MRKLTVHPNIKTGLGLAGNTYKQVIQKGEITLGELIAWAAGRGFSWFELRDAGVTMEREELLRLKALADTLGLRIHYSWDNEDVFKEDEKFYKGMEQAALFGRGTCCRVLVASKAAAGKKGYSKEEFNRLVPVINQYVKKAGELGINLCFENSMEPLFGDGASYFGMDELMEACKGMCATLDAANATNETTMVNPEEEDIISYYNKYKDRIFYYHLKVTRDHKLLDTVETEGDFHVKKLFKEFSKNPEMKICLEIPQKKTLADLNRTVERSIQVLEGE
ncbi:sugar phosphate isomerase/epimerase family protein [Lachnoclostridium edouardi]|uniref:sugar phosphate isomerase/epimerase family protein n=1 Tax=Lachnoclostridium edouardi TaxID=1926283 RepID=UPI000C7AA22F|nr:sugar phosphate isomerase/epimerase [Lachnoclostridium edouardi]